MSICRENHNTTTCPSSIGLVTWQVQFEEASLLFLYNETLGKDTRKSREAITPRSSLRFSRVLSDLPRAYITRYKRRGCCVLPLFFCFVFK